jgi:hypothetical protein
MENQATTDTTTAFIDKAEKVGTFYEEISMHEFNQSCGIRTLAVHAGEEPDAATGASAPNIVMSTTFIAAPDASFSVEGLDEETPFIYTFRSGRLTRDEHLHVTRQTAQLPRYRLGLLPNRKKPDSVSPLVMQPKESFRLMSLSSEFGSGTRKRRVRAIGL